MHILICFAKGFGLLGGVVGGLILLVYLLTKLSEWIAARTTRWDKADIAMTLVLSVGFLALGTVISLGYCGIFK